jgi:CBS domain-containing protein
MKAADIMVTKVITVGPDTSVPQVAQIMLTNRISGVPVLDRDGRLIGIVSEGDLLRRVEAGTERKRPWLLEFFTRGDTIAADYVKAHARKVSDIMTRRVATVSEDTPLAEIADMLEQYQIKRVPVMRDDKLVGIVSRSNLLQAVAAWRAQPSPEVKQDDRAIRMRVLDNIHDARLTRPAGLNVMVKDGVVDLWGMVLTNEEKNAIRVAAEVTDGVVSVKDNIFVQPLATSY